MRRLAVLGAGSAIILGIGVMGAAPAFADNGPHQSTTGSLTVDRCAGCHRAHTAKAAYLLAGATETALCENCHGASGTGATTDVFDGVGYDNTSANNGIPRAGSVVGALRGGGFDKAAIDTGNVAGGNALGSGTGVVGVYTVGGVISPQTTTSKHNVDAAGTIWGGGLSSGSVGTSTELECTSCHDPHGNGNFRILRNFSSVTDATSLVGTFAPVGLSSVSKRAATEKVGSQQRDIYDVVLTGTNPFRLGTSVAFGGTGTPLSGVTNLVVWQITDPTTLVLRASINAGVSAGAQTLPAGSFLGWWNAASVSAGTSDGTLHTYTTFAPHGLAVGQKVTIAGMLPVGYNVTQATITAVTLSTFTVSLAAGATPVASGTASTKSGYITGIPDALAKVYTITNYWRPDDHSYTGSTVAKAASYSTSTAAAGGPSGFITNISQWCATCHVRLLAGPTGYAQDTGDSDYRFLHRANNPAEGSPNCITCHVAHGSNASMSGDGKTVFSSMVTNPDGTAGDSYLLRIDNRGTCMNCHNL